jgi:hypothetical protein
MGMRDDSGIYMSDVGLGKLALKSISEHLNK